MQNFSEREHQMKFGLENFYLTFRTTFTLKSNPFKFDIPMKVPGIIS